MGDPLDVRRVLADTAELLCHEIIMDDKNRMERSNQLNYFLDRLGDNLVYGRLYSFTKLASVTFDVCARDPYPIFHGSQKGRRGRGGFLHEISKATGTDVNEEEGGGEDIEPVNQHCLDFTPLSEFTVKKWERALSELEELRNLLLRRDATRVAVPKVIPDFTPERQEAGEGSEAEEEEDGEVNEDLASSLLFAGNYKDMVNAFRFQQSFSFLRTALEEEVVRAEDEGRDTLHIAAKDLKAYEEFISEHFDEGHGIRECLESILVKGENKSSRTRSAGLALKPAAQVRDIIRGKNFDLVRFQTRIESILQKWYAAALPRPLLAELGYGRLMLPPLLERDAAAEETGEDEEIPGGDEEEVVEDHGQSPRQSTSRADSEMGSFDSGVASGAQEVARGEMHRGEMVTERESPAPAEKRRVRSPQKPQSPSEVVVEALKESRDKLLGNIDDPLHECHAQAEEAGKNDRGQKPSAASEDEDLEQRQLQPRSPVMQSKKRTKHKINFDSDESELDEPDGDSDDGRTATLSEVPERAKVRHPKKKRPTSPSRTAGQPQTRRRFTDREDAAIKIGVEKCGFGRWAVIKDYYKEELMTRTSVQIKDRYRTLMKNNLV